MAYYLYIILFLYDSFIDKVRVEKKVSFLIVECFQNVVRHGEALADSSNPRGFFTARYDGYSNHISAVNLIHSDNIPELEKLLKSMILFFKYFWRMKNFAITEI